MKTQNPHGHILSLSSFLVALAAICLMLLPAWNGSQAEEELPGETAAAEEEPPATGEPATGEGITSDPETGILSFPTFRDSAEHRRECLQQVKDIARAIQMYEVNRKHYPPPYSVDEEGNPLHSWRVLLLPYLGHQELYDEFRLDEPWDSEHNWAVAAEAENPYACPSNEGQGSYTNYMVIVGPDTIFRPGDTVRRMDIVDGVSGTLMVVEVDNETVGWTEPVDLLAEEMEWTINGERGNSIGSVHDEEGASVAFASGIILILGNNTPAEALEGMSTRAGREIIRLEDLPLIE